MRERRRVGERRGLSAMMGYMPAPELVAHADWGTHPRNREAAIGQLFAGTAPEDARYRIAGAVRPPTQLMRSAA